MDHIYVLELEEGKYYVGKTKNVDMRLDQHFDNNGSEWTKKYKPVKVIDIKKSYTIFDEDNTTIAYMKEKGIYNVRGGVYCSIVLTQDEVNAINKIIMSIENKCYKCGKNHFAKNCNQNQNQNNDNNIDKISKINKIQKAEEINEINDDIDDINNVDEIDNNQKINKITDNQNINIHHCKYCGKKFETRKKASCHENLYCKKKQKDIMIDNKSTKDNNKSIKYHESIKDDNKSTKCYKCGREGHYKSNCYAHRHINGYPLD